MEGWCPGQRGLPDSVRSEANRKGRPERDRATPSSPHPRSNRSRDKTEGSCRGHGENGW